MPVALVQARVQVSALVQVKRSKKRQFRLYEIWGPACTQALSRQVSALLQTCI